MLQFYAITFCIVITHQSNIIFDQSAEESQMSQTNLFLKNHCSSEIYHFMCVLYPGKRIFWQNLGDKAYQNEIIYQ